MTDAEAREMARELVRGSIVEDAVSQFIAQVLKHAHDERIKPLRKQVAGLEAKLAKAEAGLREIAGECGCFIARATLAEIKGESHE